MCNAKMRKQNKTGEMHMNHNYLTADSEMPLNMPYPRFLADMEISSTAKGLMYGCLINQLRKGQRGIFLYKISNPGTDGRIVKK